MISLEEAAEAGCRACGSPGGGCQFLGTAATSQVIAEALGMTVPHAALAPSGQPIWMEMARQSAAVLWDQHERKAKLSDILTPDSFYNADRGSCGMRWFDESAAPRSSSRVCRGPAKAWTRRLERSQSTRDVDLSTCCPNGPMYHPTVRLFLAGGVPGNHVAPANSVSPMRCQDGDRTDLARDSGPVGLLGTTQWRCEKCCENETVSMPIRSSFHRQSQANGANQHRLLSTRKHLPGWFRHQIDSHRPKRHRRRWRLSKDRSCSRIHH